MFPGRPWRTAFAPSWSSTSKLTRLILLGQGTHKIQATRTPSDLSSANPSVNDSSSFNLMSYCLCRRVQESARGGDPLFVCPGPYLLRIFSAQMAMAGNVHRPFPSFQGLIAHGRTRTLLLHQSPAFDPILPLWIHLRATPSAKKTKRSVAMAN